jgi:hypothetical protein
MVRMLERTTQEHLKPSILVVVLAEDNALPHGLLKLNFKV